MTGSPAYSVRVKRSAEREMGRLPAGVLDRVAAAMRRLASQPRPAGCLKLRDIDGYRIRVGRYRIVYVVDDEARVVEVVAVGHRREIYRRL